MLVVLLSLNSNYVDIPFFVLLYLVVLPCDEVDARVYSPQQLVHSGRMLPFTPRLQTGRLHVASPVKAFQVGGVLQAIHTQPTRL